MASGVNQSVRGPITTSSTTSCSSVGKSAGGSSGAATTLVAGAGCTASQSPTATGAGPTWARVSVAQLPITGASAKPPRTAT